MTRHLVGSSSAVPNHTVKVFCGGGYETYDRAEHTYLTALATCVDCLAAHAAWCVIQDARLNQDRT